MRGCSLCDATEYTQKKFPKSDQVYLIVKSIERYREYL